MPERRAAKGTASMPAGRRRAAGRSSKRRKVGALSWHSAASSARAACVACRPCRCAFQSRKIPRPTDLPASLRDSPRRDARSRRLPWDGRSGTRLPGSLYKEWRPVLLQLVFAPSVASTGIAKYLAPACRGLFVFAGQVAVLLVALRNGRAVSCIIELVFRPYPACGTTARASAVAAKSCC